MVHHGGDGRATIARITFLSRAGHRGDHTRSDINPANTVIHRLGFIQIALGIKYAHKGLTQRGRRGRTAIARVASFAGAHHAIDDTASICHSLFLYVYFRRMPLV